MKIPTYARYDYCYKKACEFLEKNDINSFPVNIEEIILKNGWALTPYSQIAEEFGCDIDTVIRCLKSEDGYTQWDGNNYSIAYNDSETLGNRIRFTLMHEVGHIFLNHLMDFEATTIYRGSLNKNEYQVLENEANAFARNVLVPVIVLQQLKNKNLYNITKTFGISTEAAKTRVNFLETDLQWCRNEGLFNRLTDIFRNFYHKKVCTKCGFGFTANSKGFCQICGSSSIKWGDGKMKYKELEQNETGKLKYCPICNNEDTHIEGEYCQICGVNLVNKCDNRDYDENDYSYDKPCGQDDLPTNARYCPICGSRTTFLNDNILKPYDHIEPKGFITESSSINIPSGIDETLPFN